MATLSVASSASGDNLVRNELLYYILNNYSKSLRDNISIAVSDFYTVEEMCAEKELLFGYVINSGLPNAPSLVPPKGNGRRRADTEDIMAALELIIIIIMAYFYYAAYTGMKVIELPTNCDRRCITKLVNSRGRARWVQTR